MPVFARVWIDEKEIGSTQNSLSAPHEYELPGKISAGKHVITIRVDNSIVDMNVGPDSHSVSDHTQGNWNGIIGKILLVAVSPIHIGGIEVYPDIANKRARLRISVINNSDKEISTQVQEAYATKLI